MLPSTKRVIPEISTLITEILKTEKVFTNFRLLFCKIAINKRVVVQRLRQSEKKHING